MLFRRTKSRHGYLERGSTQPKKSESLNQIYNIFGQSRMENLKKIINVLHICWSFDVCTAYKVTAKRL